MGSIWNLLEANLNKRCLLMSRRHLRDPQYGHIVYLGVHSWIPGLRSTLDLLFLLMIDCAFISSQDNSPLHSAHLDFIHATLDRLFSFHRSLTHIVRFLVFLPSTCSKLLQDKGFIMSKSSIGISSALFISADLGTECLL